MRIHKIVYLGNPIHKSNCDEANGKGVIQVNTLKYVFGILVLILSIGLIGAAVWYCMFRLPDQALQQGTFVLGPVFGGRFL